MKFDPFVLDTPIDSDGGSISELTISEPEALKLSNAQRALDTGVNPESASIFSRNLVMAACGISQKTADLLPLSATSDIADKIMTAIQDEVAGFEFDPSQEEMVLTDSVQVGPVSYGTLPVREPNTGELIKANSHLRTSQAPASQLKYQMALVSFVSGIPMTSIYKFPASVVMKAAKVIEGFTSSGRAIGDS